MKPPLVPLRGASFSFDLDSEADCQKIRQYLRTHVQPGISVSSPEMDARDGNEGASVEALSLQDAAADAAAGAAAAASVV